MGTWGTGLYSDDLAADLRGDYRDLIGEGLSPAAAIERLMSEYSGSLSDSDEQPVFWLALADTSWKLGRLDEHVRDNALRVIDEGRDLTRWKLARDRKKRQAVLARLRAQLLSPQPVVKHVPKAFKSDNEWSVGEVIAFQLLSRRWVPLRVIGHHMDKGGRSAVCELLDWTGASIPSTADVAPLTVRRENKARGVSQFLFQEPKTNKDRRRIVRTGVISRPLQTPGGYTVLVWPYVDRLFRDTFGLE